MKRTILISILSLTSSAWAAVSTQPMLPASAIEENLDGHVESPLNGALELQFTPVGYDNLDWQPGVKNGKRGLGFRIAGEWLPDLNIYGKPGIGFATGLNLISNAGISSYSTASLFAIPAEVFVSYHFDYMKNQFLVPFAKVGFNGTWAQQKDTFAGGTDQSTYIGWGWDWSAGAEICLNVIDPSAARQFDAHIGVNNTYLVLEYYRSQSLTGAKQPDFSSEQYRAGLRFEM